MSDETAPPKPPKPPRAADKSSRLAAALRANLARRKAQQRERAEPETAENAPENELG